MWYRYFKDYPPDSPLIKEQVSPGHGIIGCEMHELNGWGSTYHSLGSLEPSPYNEMVKHNESKRDPYLGS